jgi:hypothetical protein
MLSIDFCLFSSASRLKVYSLAPDLLGLLCKLQTKLKGFTAVIVEVLRVGVVILGDSCLSQFLQILYKV